MFIIVCGIINKMVFKLIERYLSKIGQLEGCSFFMSQNNPIT